MGSHGQSPWDLHEIPSYAKASEDDPPVAKSAEALIRQRMNDPTKAYAFIHGQSPCLHAGVLAFVETFRAGVPARRRAFLRRRINGYSFLKSHVEV